MKLESGRPMKYSRAIPPRNRPASITEFQNTSSGVDRRDLHAEILLAMADGLMETLAAGVLDGADLLALHLGHDVAGYRRAHNRRLANLGSAVAADEEHAVKREG